MLLQKPVIVFTVGVTSIAMQTIAPATLLHFQQTYPEIELEVRELPTHAQIEALLTAEIDVGFLLTPANNTSLIVEPVHRECMKLAIYNHHPHALVEQETSVPLSAFASDNFIIPSRQQNSTIYDEVIRTCKKSRFSSKIKRM